MRFLRSIFLLPALGTLVVASGFAACSASNPPNQFGQGGAGGNASGQGGFTSGPGTGGSNLGGHFGTGGSTGTGMNVCKVNENGNGSVPMCMKKSPPNAFSPQVAWTFDGPPPDPGATYGGSFGVPLVGNFTDDNNDGAIDLCDTPDVIIQTLKSFTFGGGAQLLVVDAYMSMLAGDTGKLEVQFDGLVDGLVYPAFGDIDGDGYPDVVAADSQGHLVAYDHQGHLKWTGDLGGYRTTFASAECTTIAIYDLDGDGQPEILFGWEVFNNKGHKLWGDPTNAAEFDGQYWCVTPTAADLDGDGKLEVLFGHETYHSDGTLYWKLPNFTPAHPQVAQLDNDPEPEVFLTNQDGITIVEHDGKIKFGPVRPTMMQAHLPQCWGKPAVVTDFDGDGKADIAAATCNDYTVYKVGPNGLTILWSAPVSDQSGLATATAFDFLGSGAAQAIYADETQVWAFDGKTGKSVFTSPRSSGTLIEYPVVADIDNDGSAEIAYVSNFPGGAANGQHSLTVLKDAQSRWIPARRIWNQYSYHVTNVREDGTIPKKPKNNWQFLNTFRVNSQISVDGDCSPNPPK